MKPYFVFSTVWHDKDNPTSVSSYEFYVVARSMSRAKQMIEAELKTYKCFEFTIDNIEEIELGKGEHFRHLVSTTHEKVIVNKALEKTLKLKRKSEREVHKASYTCSADSITALISNPGRLYFFFKGALKPSSKIFVSNGQLRIYSLEGPTFYDREFLEKKKKELEEGLQLYGTKVKETRSMLSEVDEELKKNDQNYQST